MSDYASVPMEDDQFESPDDFWEEVMTKKFTVEFTQDEMCSLRSALKNALIDLRRNKLRGEYYQDLERFLSDVLRRIEARLNEKES